MPEKIRPCPFCGMLDYSQCHCDVDIYITAIDNLTAQVDQMAICLKDCLILMEEHGGKIISSHVSRLSNSYRVLFNYQKSRGIIK
jgi:hypothetical protein